MLTVPSKLKATESNTLPKTKIFQWIRTRGSDYDNRSPKRLIGHPSVDLRRRNLPMPQLYTGLGIVNGEVSGHTCP
jgi:hypothetical protein